MHLWRNDRLISPGDRSQLKAWIFEAVATRAWAGDNLACGSVEADRLKGSNLEVRLRGVAEKGYTREKASEGVKKLATPIDLATILSQLCCPPCGKAALGSS